MIKYLKTSELVDNEINKVPDTDYFKDLDQIKIKYPVVIEYNHADNINLKDTALVLAADIKEHDVLVYDMDEGMGGGGGSFQWFNFANFLQTVIIFVSLEVASAVIGDLYQHAKEKIKAFFRNTAKMPKNLPFYIRINGSNNSAFRFHFFSFFDEEEFLDAWGAIPETIANNKLEKNVEKIFLFDPKQKKWFVEGAQYFDNF